MKIEKLRLYQVKRASKTSPIGSRWMIQGETCGSRKSAKCRVHEAAEPGSQRPPRPWQPRFSRVASICFATFHCLTRFSVYTAVWSLRIWLKRRVDSIVLASLSLTQTPWERLEEGESRSSESNGVEAKSKDHHSGF